MKFDAGANSPEPAHIHFRLSFSTAAVNALLACLAAAMSAGSSDTSQKQPAAGPKRMDTHVYMYTCIHRSDLYMCYACCCPCLCNNAPDAEKAYLGTSGFLLHRVGW